MNERAAKRAAEVVKALDGFLDYNSDNVLGEPNPPDFQGVRLRFKDVDLVDTLFMFLQLADQQWVNYIDHKRMAIEAAFDDANLAKIEVAFTGDPNCVGARTMSQYFQVYGGRDPEGQLSTFIEEVSRYHRDHPNPYHRLKAIMRHIAENEGTFPGPWDDA